MSESTGKQQLLLVDPDESYREVMTDILSEHMDISFASDAKEAIALITEYDFALIITEIDLPDGDIYHFLSLLKDVVLNPNYVIISKERNPDMTIELLKMGAIDIIHKPFTIEEIATLIEKYMQISVNKKMEYDLMGSLEEEKRTFCLPTNLFIINPFLYDVMEMLKRFPGVDKKVLFSIRLSLYEMMVNAIEHGNLEVDYAEKKKLLDTGENYLDILKERSWNEPYRSRKIWVGYHYKNGTLKITVKDEGKGFRTSTYNNDKVKIDTEELHGRGIFITKVNMDKIEYNKKGNQVTLEKILKHP